MSSHIYTTPLRSPEQIFANSVTPVIIDSSPAVPKSAHLWPPSPLTLLRQFSNPRPGRLESPREKRQLSGYATQSDIRGVLGVSPGRENIPINRETQAAGKKRKAKTQSQSGGKEASAKGLPAYDQCTAKSNKKPSKDVSTAKKSRKSASSVNLTLDGKVTKAGVQRPQPVKRSRESNMTSVFGVEENIPGDVEGLHLEQAIKRRDDWTPTRDTERSIVDLEREGGSSPRFDEPRKGNLLFEYGFNGITDTIEEEVPHQTEGGPTKKRRVELVKCNPGQTKIQPVKEGENGLIEDSGEGTTTKPAKKKASRKTKLTTITSYSTAPYGTSSAGASDTTESLAPKEKGKSRKKLSKSKSQAKTGPSDKEPPTFKVVPPLEAFKSLENQEWLFGTSSQLARDEAPNCSSAPAAAIPNDPDTSMRPSGMELQPSLLSSSKITSMSKLSGSRNLWSASARDFTGELAEVDVVDLANTPKASASPKIYRNAENKNTKPADEFPDIDNFIPARLSEPTPESTSGNGNVRPRKSSSETASSAHVSIDSEVEEIPESDVEQPPAPTRPSFHGFSTAELAQQVAKYGFKAIKGRDKMVSLLEKCWDNQYRPKQATTTAAKAPSDTVSNSTSSATSVCQAEVTEPPHRNDKPKSRARRKPSQDSAALASSKPRSQRRAKNPPKSTDQHTLTSKVDEVMIPSSPPPQHANIPTPEIFDFGPGPIIRSPEPPKTSHRAIFKFPSTDFPDFEAQITEAVKAQPRLRAINGVKQPTWHEKILLYDPIPLEDLAAWLNTEGFNRIGEDREVCAAQVREWCENKGVCCVWKKPASS